jgi:hypothetical protein
MPLTGPGDGCGCAHAAAMGLRGAPRPHRSDLRSGANADKVLGVYFSRPGHCALRPIPPPDQIQAGSWLVRELSIKRRRTEVFV